MTTLELIEQISKRTQTPKSKVARILDALATAMYHSLKKQEKFELPGIGSFVVSERQQRTGRSPAGMEVSIEAHRVPLFSSASSLRRELNPERDD